VTALHKKSQFRLGSAKGAKYDRQGQALSNAKRVALGHKHNEREALKERNN
jgi:hypothetical protein